ncbi:MAG: hypothetical protein AB1384_15090 [Actinomycetota bacterium]
MNFFIQQLVDYYAEGGKTLPPEVLSVLAKPLASLNQEEADIYNRFIGPSQQRISAALLERLQQQGSNKLEWSQQVNQYYRPIVEEIAARMLGLEVSAPLPQAVTARVAYARQGPARRSFLQRLSIPRISYWWVAAVVVVIALVTAGTWFYVSATAPSRMLNRIRGEVAAGSYSSALQHIDEMRVKYPDKEQTEEAEEFEPEAALGYAYELYANASYGEAARYFQLAGEDDDLESEALTACAGAYLAGATVHSQNHEYEEGYDCCELALDYAPQGYDVNPIMATRADLLYNWGMQLKSQNLYALSAIRFEKCFTEWPAGTHAQDALVNYVDMTASGYTNQLPNKATTSSGRLLEIRISNLTSYTGRYFFSGPSSLYVDIGPNGAATVFLPPGIYCRGFLPTGGSGRFTAGTDLTDARYIGWTITISPIEIAPTQGVGYDAVRSRVDQLEPTLPPEILECVEDLRYEQITDPIRAQDRYGDYDPSAEVVGFTPNIPSNMVDLVIFHEWGHAYDDEYLDAEEKERYKELRGILPDVLWNDPDNYSGSVEEDFAEVFAVLFGHAEWENHTPYGPVVNQDELRSFILAAAD